MNSNHIICSEAIKRLRRFDLSLSEGCVFLAKTTLSRRITPYGRVMWAKDTEETSGDWSELEQISLNDMNEIAQHTPDARGRVEWESGKRRLVADWCSGSFFIVSHFEPTSDPSDPAERLLYDLFAASGKAADPSSTYTWIEGLRFDRDEFAALLVEMEEIQQRSSRSAPEKDECLSYIMDAFIADPQAFTDANQRVVQSKLVEPAIRFLGEDRFSDRQIKRWINQLKPRLIEEGWATW